jgi:hypothetical protein
MVMPLGVGVSYMAQVAKVQMIVLDPAGSAPLIECRPELQNYLNYNACVSEKETRAPFYFQVQNLSIASNMQAKNYKLTHKNNKPKPVQ